MKSAALKLLFVILGKVFLSKQKFIKFIRDKWVGAFFRWFFLYYLISKHNIFGSRYFKHVVVLCNIWPGKRSIWDAFLWIARYLLWHTKSSKRETQLCCLSLFVEIYVSGHRARAGCFMHCLSWAASLQQCRDAACLSQGPPEWCRGWGQLSPVISRQESLGG